MNRRQREIERGPVIRKNRNVYPVLQRQAEGCLVSKDYGEAKDRKRHTFVPTNILTVSSLLNQSVMGSLILTLFVMVV